MAQVVPLYQVGGFRAHTSGQPDCLAADLCPSKGGIELTLGVLPSGATYLLLEEDHFFRVFRRSRDKPWHSDEFRSLSPVYFSSRESLEEKLDLFVSNKKAKAGGPRDRSKANTGYTIHDIQSLTELGESRSEFELQRVYYRLCRGQLPRQRIYDVPLPIVACLKSMRLVAFTFNLWRMDRRPLGERIATPKILDIGWTEFVLPDAAKDLQVKASLHWIIDEGKMFSNPDAKRLEFKHGNSETLQQNSVASHLQTLFADVSPNVMLLVHDKVATHQVLKSLGIDIASWQGGLYNVYKPPRSPRSSDIAPRRRSRSPGRNSTRDPRQRPHSDSSDSSAKSNIKPIRIDIQQLFSTLKQIPLSEVSIDGAARHLQLVDASDGSTRGWCAGNESVLLGNIWEAMASGNAIDDQRLLRWSTASRKGVPAGVAEDVKPFMSSVAEESASEPTHAAHNDSDSDFDPNDVAPASNQGGFVVEGNTQPALPPTEGGGSAYRDPYEELDDEDDW